MEGHITAEWCRRALEILGGPLVKELLDGRTPRLVVATFAERKVGDEREVPAYPPAMRVASAPETDAEFKEYLLDDVVHRFPIAVVEVPVAAEHLSDWGLPSEGRILERWTQHNSGSAVAVSGSAVDLAELLDCRGLGPGAVIGFVDPGADEALRAGNTHKLLSMDATVLIPVFDDEGLAVIDLPAP